MTKFTLTIFLLINFQSSLFSQDLRNELQTRIWYWTGDINDSLPIILTDKRPNKFHFIADFNSSHHLILTSFTSDKIDSIFSYAVGNGLLVLAYQNKDSLHQIHFHATISPDKNQILLKRDFFVKVTYPGRDTMTFDYIYLTKGSRIRDVLRGDNIIVYNKIDDSSELIERTRGDFYQVRGDSLFIDTERIFRRHFLTTGRDTVPSHFQIVRLHNITKFYHERKKFNMLSGMWIGLSVLSTLIVSPLIFIEEGGQEGLKATGILLASTAFLITLRVELSHKKMKIKKSRNSWKLW